MYSSAPCLPWDKSAVVICHGVKITFEVSFWWSEKLNQITSFDVCCFWCSLLHHVHCCKDNLLHMSSEYLLTRMYCKLTPNMPQQIWPRPWLTLSWKQLILYHLHCYKPFSPLRWYHHMKSYKHKTWVKLTSADRPVRSYLSTLCALCRECTTLNLSCASVYKILDLTSSGIKTNWFLFSLENCHNTGT